MVFRENYVTRYFTNLVGLRVVSLDAVEVGLPVVSAHCVQQVVQHGDTHAAASLRHRCYHLPLARLWVETLH